MTSTATPATEEYLQAVYTLADESGTVIAARLAGFLGVSAAAVSEMLHRMERDGLLQIDERKEVHLTASGAAAAASIVRRHRLAERMLVDLLGYPWWESHEDAERLEHAMSAEMERKLIERLGDPRTCPHGNPMPGMTGVPTKPLEAVAAGGTGVIERIPDQFEHEPGFLKYLDGVGVKPGVAVKVVEISASALRVEIAGEVRSIRPDCGHKVWVRA